MTLLLSWINFIHTSLLLFSGIQKILKQWILGTQVQVLKYLSTVIATVKDDGWMNRYKIFIYKSCTATYSSSSSNVLPTSILFSLNYCTSHRYSQRQNSVNTRALYPITLWGLCNKNVQNHVPLTVLQRSKNANTP